MKIIYAGTPDFAVPALQALIKSQHQVIAVYTQPDRPAGRGRKIQSSVVKQVAVAENIPVFQPHSLRDTEAVSKLQSLDADVMVVAAYGLILPETVLSAPKYGCVNIHASLLPRWRGAAPIQRAILAGDKKTGVTIMQMAKGLDTGDILYQSALAINSNDTSAILHDRLSWLGATALMTTLSLMESGEVNAQPQEDLKAVYAEKLSKAEAEIDWGLEARDIVRMINAFNPWPVAQTQVDGKTLRIRTAQLDEFTSHSIPGSVIAEDKGKGIQVATGNGTVWLRDLQLPGKKSVPVRDFLNGHSLSGKILGR